MAFAILLRPGAALAELSASSGRSIGDAHNSIRRLGTARLLRPASRVVEWEPFIRFLRWGVPHAYPPATGALTRGFPTATKIDSETAEAEVEFVWPSADGPSSGQALAPPYPGAIHLPARNPVLYRVLSLVDALRVGGVREQEGAIIEIEAILNEVKL